MTEKLPFLLAAVFAAAAFAAEPVSGGAVSEAVPEAGDAPAAEAAEPADGPRPEKPTPGPVSKNAREYMSRLEAIRKARDEKGLAAVKAGEAIESRKTELAQENEEVGKLAARIAELEAELAKARTELDGLYAVDGKLQELAKAKDAAEAERDGRQRELNGAIAEAMRRRMGSGEGGGAPAFRRTTPEERKAEWNRRRAAVEARGAGTSGKDAAAAESAAAQ